MNQNWIGAWSPGIGDPTVGGWVTVGLYAWAAWASYRVLHRERRQAIVLNAHERLIWRLMMVGMIFLGINKQLDLQSAMTELMRLISVDKGWYVNRRQYQEAFIAAMPVLGLTALAAMVVLTWDAPRPTMWACAGAATLMVFVAIRAASFHHVDRLLGWHLGVLSINWVLEMGSSILIGWSARRRVLVQA